MTKPVKISTVLTRAANWIDEHGLAKGAYWKYRNNQTVYRGTIEEAAAVARERGCSACLIGAIYLAAGESATSYDMDWHLDQALPYLKPLIGKIWPPFYNDEPERTKEEVVQTLKDAARAARKDGK